MFFRFLFLKLTCVVKHSFEHSVCVIVENFNFCKQGKLGCGRWQYFTSYEGGDVSVEQLQKRLLCGGKDLRYMRDIGFSRGGGRVVAQQLT